MFPEIKAKTAIKEARQLKEDLQILRKSILKFTPGFFDPRRLNTLRIRIFNFPKKEDCNEFFETYKNKKYVSLNAKLLKKKYYSGLQFLLHGIAHSFCYLKDDIAQEIFCEYVAYSLIDKLLENKSEKLKRRVIRGIMNSSPKEYNTYFRVGRKLEKKKSDLLIKLNTKSKNNKISKKKEKRIFYKVMKFRKVENEPSDDKLPELENGFKLV